MSKVHEYEKFVARLKPGQRERIRTVAEFTNRSMNSEIQVALEKHLKEIEREMKKGDQK